MIKSFIFRNFKSFRSSVLWLEQTTTLIGSNASGKSNALEGIYLLSELASGQTLDHIFDESRSDSIVRGSAKGCCYRGSDSFTLGCTMDYDAEKDLLYEITVCADENDIIVAQFEEYWQTRQPIGRIRIWSLDTHLAPYQYEGGLRRRKDK